MKQKLTDEDRQQIAELKAMRGQLIREARQISDKRIAEKFEVCRGTVERIPAWNT